MGDDGLLSIAFSNSSCNTHSSSSSSSSASLPWKNHFHNIGVFKEAHLSPYMMNNLPPPPPSDHRGHGDTCLKSTGYLEDVLSQYLICSSKRRKLLMSSHHHPQTTDNQFHFELDTSSILQNLWTPSLSSSNDLIEECCSYGGTKNHDYISSSVNNQDYMKRITPEEEEGISEATTVLLQEDSSSSPQKDHSINNNTPQKANLHCLRDPNTINSSEIGKKTKKRTSTNVTYPFAVVKPGGCEGEVTLNDINKRILMPPMRPVRHPVGDYACRPMILPEGPGLSGKAVVAFTRIHTQGRRGTITIIRTRG